MSETIFPYQFPITSTVINRRTCTSIDGCSHGGRNSCVFEQERATPNAGCASDHYCTHPSVTYKKIMGYVEGYRDMKPVPEWCPILQTKV
jgi:hypothetical protein